MATRTATVHRELDERAVAITLDDGPDPAWTPHALEALADAGASATFFVTPRHGLDLVGRIAAEGHEVGYHCGRHVRHTERSRDEVAEEATEDLAVLAAMGLEVRTWRPPWGVLAEWTADLAAELGLGLWLWSCDTEDWRGRSADSMLAGLREDLGPGSVVLMHDGIGPGALRENPADTIALIEPLVGLIRSRGLRPATLSGGPVRDRDIAGEIR